MTDRPDDAQSEHVIIVNPMAGSAERLLELEAMLTGRSHWRIIQTEREGHAQELARELLDSGVRTIVAAGGDGTIHEVIHGMRCDEPVSGTRLGVIPMGTGNDLARSLALPHELIDLIELIERGEATSLDLIEVSSEGSRKFAVNAANGGNAELTHELIDDEIKQRWGALAYLIAAIQAVGELETYHAEISWPEGTTTEAEIFGVVVANGTSLGGGMVVAPHASTSDGLLDVVMVKAVPPIQLARLAGRLLDPGFNITDDEAILFRRATAVSIDASPQIWFNLDGEPFERGATTFRIIPAALQVVHGVTTPGG